MFAVTEARLPKDRDAIEHNFQVSSQNAEIANADFWKTVSEMFDGVPTMERLEQIWNEQEAMISALFAENSNGEGNAGL